MLRAIDCLNHLSPPIFAKSFTLLTMLIGLG